MIILKSIRSDKVVDAVQDWINDTMGEKFTIPPVFDISKGFKDSTVLTPLIFVLSSGSDPVQDFLRFAEE
jgi:dynein heavy chain, axonemal